MSKTYRITLVKFVNTLYGEANAQDLMRTHQLTHDQLAQRYIDELARHGSRVGDLQNTIYRLNNPQTQAAPYERSVYSLENWMRKVMTERWRASNPVKHNNTK